MVSNASAVLPLPETIRIVAAYPFSTFSQLSNLNVYNFETFSGILVSLNAYFLKRVKL